MLSLFTKNKELLYGCAILYDFRILKSRYFMNLKMLKIIFLYSSIAKLKFAYVNYRFKAKSTVSYLVTSRKTCQVKRNTYLAWNRISFSLNNQLTSFLNIVSKLMIYFLMKELKRDLMFNINLNVKAYAKLSQCEIRLHAIESYLY